MHCRHWKNLVSSRFVSNILYVLGTCCINILRKLTLLDNKLIMTIREAILQSLEDLQQPASYLDVYHQILAKKYYDTSAAKTPASTISAQLGEFIRNGDTRVKRIKKPGGTYVYYLAKNELNIEVEILAQSSEADAKKAGKVKSYEERDLHKLVSSYLKNSRVYSKTIFHEQSVYGKDANQIWTHPDMVGVQFLNMQSTTGQNFLKVINPTDTFRLSAYEIKREINSDNELKKAFFQAVSNSSWANFGFLVAFEFGDSLKDEMERLNQSFGIGIIKLKANPYESTILFPARYRDLDFKTIDKLCNINDAFEKFIELIERLMTADHRYYNSTEKELNEFCDPVFLNDTEMENYYKEKRIPTEENGLNE